MDTFDNDFENGSNLSLAIVYEILEPEIRLPLKAPITDTRIPIVINVAPTLPKIISDTSEAILFEVMALLNPRTFKNTKDIDTKEKLDDKFLGWYLVVDLKSDKLSKEPFNFKTKINKKTKLKAVYVLQLHLIQKEDQRLIV